MKKTPSQIGLLILTSLIVLWPMTTRAEGSGAGTTVVTGGSQISIIVNVELWGDGIYKDPALASRWEQAIEKIWNNGSDGVKYKCYDVKVDAVIKVSDAKRTTPRGGDASYHQIWVPDVTTGDMANTYNSYGLYAGEGGSSDYAYGELDPDLAQEYYEKYTPEELQEKGKGQTKGFIRSYEDIGSDSQKAATWGTLPNTISNQVVAHEFGHLMGVNHDAEQCTDNLMSPFSSSKRSFEQVYPRYFKRMLDDISLMCEWKLKTTVTMDARSVGTYFPPAMQGHNDFTLTEKKAYQAITTSPADLTYDSIEPNFTCNVFTWASHNGKIGYTGDIRYNFKEDLKTGGRIILKSTVGQQPYEEIQSIAGCGRPNPSDLTKVDPINHHNFLYSLTGENLQITPYNNSFDAKTACPAEPEENVIEEVYTKGVVVNGADTDAKAEHFPEADLYGAKFKYDITVLDAQPTDNGAVASN